MGIEYSARIVVGLPKDELDDYFEGVENVYQHVEDSGLYVVSPYYDADYDDCLFGVLVQRCYDYSYSEIDETMWSESIASAHKKFTEVTGKVGKLYLSTYGS